MKPMVDRDVELHLFNAPDGQGPVTCGVPWPGGVLRSTADLSLRDRSGQAIPLQARALDYWSDGSVRWVLLDWIAKTAAVPYQLTVGEGDPVLSQCAVKAVSKDGKITVETGTARFEVAGPGMFPFYSVHIG